MSGNTPAFKMKAFTLNPNKKILSKKELEKAKQAEDEAATAEVFDEFVKAFEAPTSKAKAFVKGSSVVPGKGEVMETSTSKVMYETSRMKLFEDKGKSTDNFSNLLKKESEKSLASAKKPSKEKKKSNLELFKEELMVLQKEREERHKLKASTSSRKDLPPKEVVLQPEVLKEEISSRPVISTGSFDTGDPNTTNLYLGNIHPKMTEQQLMETFGRFGPLASVKVMWPRTEEERARNRNCGFVAFMCRKDGENALKYLNGKEVMGYEMKLGWGKAVPIPPQPVYVPPSLSQFVMPPPPSGLPFNAQPAPEDSENVKNGFKVTATNLNELDVLSLLERATVKVVTPTDRNVLSLIHRMVEFVVNEGPMFEAMIMNREIQNPNFRFLFDNTSPAHVYYRWKLFSILQGDSTSSWSLKPFRMFEGGSMWNPPPINLYTQGMPEDLLPKDLMITPEKETIKPEPKTRARTFKEFKKGSLTDSQRDKIEKMLRNLTPERSAISLAMIYCIDHADACEEIVECITQSLTVLETPLHRKLARLYLVSDLLHNCIVKVANASMYRRYFESHVESIAHGLHEAYDAIEGRLKAEHFKQRVMNVFRVWEDWAIYSTSLLSKIQNIFLGLLPKNTGPEDEEDIDGLPLENTDDNEDVDGVPITEPEDTSAITKFKPSKWETVDPLLVEAQAMTTSKLEEEKATKRSLVSEYESDESDIDGVPLEDLKTFTPIHIDPARRNLLREVENEVLKFQDDLESGKKNCSAKLTIQQEVEEYRKKLLQRMDKSSPTSSVSSDLNSDRKRKRSRSPSSSRSKESQSSHSRSHRSHSPRKRERSRSPSHHRSHHRSSHRESRDSRDWSPNRSRTSQSRHHSSHRSPR